MIDPKEIPVVVSRLMKNRPVAWGERGAINVLHVFHADVDQRSSLLKGLEGYWRVFNEAVGGIVMVRFKSDLPAR